MSPPLEVLIGFVLAIAVACGVIFGMTASVDVAVGVGANGVAAVR